MTVLLTGVIGALIGAVATAAISLSNNLFTQSIRDEERKAAAVIRERDLSESAKLRQEDHNRSDQAQLQAKADAAFLRQEAQRREDALRREAHGHNEARELLQKLASLERHFRSQKRTEHGTYSVDPEIAFEIVYQLRLVPDPELRQLVSLAISVIRETWVVDSTEGLPVAGFVAQMDTLVETMDSVGQYIVGEEWSRASIAGFTAVKSDIDAAWKDYFATT